MLVSNGKELIRGLLSFYLNNFLKMAHPQPLFGFVYLIVTHFSTNYGNDVKGKDIGKKEEVFISHFITSTL